MSDTPFDPAENANIPTVAYELPDGQVPAALSATAPPPLYLPNSAARPVAPQACWPGCRASRWELAREPICAVGARGLLPPTLPPALAPPQEIHVGADRFTVPEVLFNPPLLKHFGDVGGGSAQLPGLQLVINDCIQR